VLPSRCLPLSNKRGGCTYYIHPPLELVKRKKERGHPSARIPLRMAFFPSQATTAATPPDRSPEQPPEPPEEQ